MEALRLGSKGPIVVRWKTFLRGMNLFHGEVDDEFDADTEEATERFQALHHLGVDGIAGNETLGRAMVSGFEIVGSSDAEKTGPNWPLPPKDLHPMNQGTRQRLFGQFQFKAAPSTGDPEAILILGDWTKDNITMVEVPQLRSVKYAPSNQKIAWNTRAVGQLKALFAAWERAGLMHLVLTWGGSWCPRFVRGSKTNLSNHAWATAFDINVPWNGLGVRPALVGRTGSVRELVQLANENGFWWGGHGFGTPGSRLDGMHFEVAKVV